ncbi:SigE family RNA polymerase sigma factor [Streptomyces sp. NPDC059697]|uniref:SigE family RNA polymerase sigma factor n=1 Tax=Streptomyces sp. NPDC059697 TaxID=3346912 RepID=UPI003674ABA3
MDACENVGEIQEFDEYIRKQHAVLLRSARWLVADPLDAQDLLQTALGQTYPRWEGIADKRLADAYVRRVMINIRTQWWRTRRLKELPVAHLPDASVGDGTEQHADHELLMDIMKTLPPKQRSVVVLRHWEQMSIQETAAALGMAPGTVKSTLHRALALLRREWERRTAPDRVNGCAVADAGGQQDGVRDSWLRLSAGVRSLTAVGPASTGAVRGRE